MNTTTTLWNYAGITGKNIDAVRAALESQLWEFIGIDYDDGSAVFVFEMGNATINVHTDANGVCGKVEEIA